MSGSDSFLKRHREKEKKTFFERMRNGLDKSLSFVGILVNTLK